MHCTASVAAIAKLEYDYSSSIFSVDGTHAHTVCQRCLEDLDLDPFDLVGTELQDHDGKFTVTVENAECSLAYRSYILEHCDPRGDDILWVEQKLPLFYERNSTGTGDAVAYVYDKEELHVFDYKNGQGVPVNAKNSSQIRIYGISAMESVASMFDVQKLIVHIIQPRCNKPGAEKYSKVELSMDDVKAFKAEVAVSVEAIDSGNTCFKAGEDICKFCRLEPICEERANYMLKSIGHDFDTIMDTEIPVDPRLDKVNGFVAPAFLGFVLNRRTEIKAYLKALEEYAFRELAAGRPICGCKLVAGRGSKRFTDEDAVVNLMIDSGLSEEDLFEVTFKSPNAVDTTITKPLTDRVAKKKLRTELEKLITKTQGKPTIVPISDPRPEFEPNATGDFDDVCFDEDEV